jgi:TonB family protein
MSQHADILDERDPLGRWLAGSVVLHVSVVVLLAASGWWREQSKNQWGDEHSLGGQIGAVPITAVSKIPLPNNSVQQNLVANDTEHSVPQKTDKTEKREVLKEDPEAIALDVKKNKQLKKPNEQLAFLKKYQAVPDSPNQLRSTTGAQASSPIYGQKGIGGVGLGASTTAGRGCGGYLELVRQRIQVKWDSDPVSGGLTASVSLRLRLLRNGTVGDVSVLQASRRNDVDYAAKRAIVDAGPFQPFFATCEGNEANIEVRFEPKR